MFFFKINLPKVKIQAVLISIVILGGCKTPVSDNIIGQATEYFVYKQGGCLKGCSSLQFQVNSKGMILISGNKNTVIFAGYLTKKDNREFWNAIKASGFVESKPGITPSSEDSQQKMMAYSRNSVNVKTHVYSQGEPQNIRKIESHIKTLVRKYTPDNTPENHENN